MKQFLQWKKIKEKSYAEFRDTKSHGIPRNSAEFDTFRNTEFRVNPRNLGQFRILYGIKKKIRNSV